MPLLIMSALMTFESFGSFDDDFTRADEAHFRRFLRDTTAMALTPFRSATAAPTRERMPSSRHATHAYYRRRDGDVTGAFSSGLSFDALGGRYGRFRVSAASDFGISFRLATSAISPRRKAAIAAMRGR